MPSEYQIRQEMAKRQDAELAGLTARLEVVEDERDYLLGENRRLLDSLFEEQRQRREISKTLGIDGGATYDQAISKIVALYAAASLRAKDAPEVTVKAKRPRKAKWGGQ